MCQVLEVSRSGYYDWFGRGESRRSVQDKVLIKQIRKVHESHKEAYGTVNVRGSGLWILDFCLNLVQCRTQPSILTPGDLPNHIAYRTIMQPHLLPYLH